MRASWARFWNWRGPVCKKGNPVCLKLCTKWFEINFLLWPNLFQNIFVDFLLEIKTKWETSWLLSFFFPAKQMLLLHESSRLSEGLTRRPFSLSYCGYKNSPLYTYRWKRGWSWPRFDTALLALVCKLCSYAN